MIISSISLNQSSISFTGVFYGVLRDGVVELVPSALLSTSSSSSSLSSASSMSSSTVGRSTSSVSSSTQKLTTSSSSFSSSSSSVSSVSSSTEKMTTSSSSGSSSSTENMTTSSSSSTENMTTSSSSSTENMTTSSSSSTENMTTSSGSSSTNRMTTSSSVSSSSDLVLKNSYLKAYWSFDDFSNLGKDSVGSNDLTIGIVGANSTSLSKHGGFGLGSPSILKSGNSPAMLPDLDPSQYAFSFWYLGGSINPIGWSNAFSGIQHAILTDSGSNVYVMGNVSSVSPSTPVVYGDHIVVIYDLYYFYIYVNGILMVTWVGTTQSPDTFVIDLPNAGAAIDELAYWKNIVFSSADDREHFVKDLYNNGDGRFYVGGDWV